jgi:hypothetical protein
MTALYATVEPYFPLLALALSLVSLSAAIVSLRRTSLYQRFDYAERLEILDELVQFISPVGDKYYVANMGKGGHEASASEDVSDVVFRYEGKVHNKGSKTVQVTSIYIDYGADQDEAKRIKHVVDGEFYLSPDDYREIGFSRSPTDIDEVSEQYAIRECLFFLRIVYRSIEGKTTEAVRPLGGFVDGQVRFVAQRGDSLT